MVYNDDSTAVSPQDPLLYKGVFSSKLNAKHNSLYNYALDKLHHIKYVGIGEYSGAILNDILLAVCINVYLCGLSGGETYNLAKSKYRESLIGKGLTGKVKHIATINPKPDAHSGGGYSKKSTFEEITVNGSTYLYKAVKTLPCSTNKDLLEAITAKSIDHKTDVANPKYFFESTHHSEIDNLGFAWFSTPYSFVVKEQFPFDGTAAHKDYFEPVIERYLAFQKRAAGIKDNLEHILEPAEIKLASIMLESTINQFIKTAHTTELILSTEILEKSVIEAKVLATYLACIENVCGSILKAFFYESIPKEAITDYIHFHYLMIKDSQKYRNVVTRELTRLLVGIKLHIGDLDNVLCETAESVLLEATAHIEFLSHRMDVLKMDELKYEQTVRTVEMQISELLLKESAKLHSGLVLCEDVSANSFNSDGEVFDLLFEAAKNAEASLLTDSMLKDVGRLKALLDVIGQFENRRTAETERDLMMSIVISI